MLPRRQRIPGREFPALKPRRKAASAYFVVKEFTNDTTTPRYAIVVGAGVDKRAYRRNVLRRRAAAVLLRSSLPPGDFVLIILPPAGKLAREEFVKELEAVLNQ